jgi:hypothetical protein
MTQKISFTSVSRRVDDKLDRLLATGEATTLRLASIESRMTSLEASIVHVHERMDGVQKHWIRSAGALTVSNGA